MNPIRVLAFYDYRGWAWWHRLRHLQRYLPSDIRLDIREIYENFPYTQYDFFMVFEEYLLPLLQYVPAEKIIAGSSCLRIADKAYVAQMQGKCFALVFNSLEMFQTAALSQRAYCCQNGVDANLFSPASRPPETFTACWIGNENSICEKGLDIIQEACRQADVPLLFRNQSKERSTLSQEELRDRYYRNASVYLCASRWEGTPNPALEALACGLPVISTPVGNMPEILMDGHNGFLVRRTTEDMAAALRRLRDMDQAALSIRARQSVLNGWTWADQTQKYVAMFRELATLQRLKPERFANATKNGYMQFLLNEGRLSWAFRYSPLWRGARQLRMAAKKIYRLFANFSGQG
ncbi:MAG: glycosyltransferase family 4 protein [Desulfovibrio sp.]|nr:glycosyltransferase family 4 protein [Desulfovibrio sp.]